MPGVDFENLNELQEVNSMLAERVIEWTEEWKQQGLQQGRQEGEASLLLRLMELRFGNVDDVIRKKLQAADAETLLHWGERLLNAASPEDVLTD